MTKLLLFNGKFILSPLAVFLVALVTVLDRTGTVLQFLLASVLHETGHLIAIRLCGGQIKRVIFEPFALTVERSNTDTSIKKDMLISGAGITVNLLLALIFFAAFKVLHFESALEFCVANILVGGYNLLPLSYLDGGELIGQCERLILKEKANGIMPKAFHIFTVVLGIIAAGVLLASKNRLAALLCLYPALLSPLKYVTEVRTGRE